MEQKSNKTKVYKKWWFWAVIALVVLRLIVALSTEPEPAGYFNADGSLKKDAASDFTFIAQKAVKAYLKAPSTAEFEQISDKWYTFEDDVFALSGEVTAQNALGVPIRDEFFVKFRYGGDYKDYEIMVVMIGDNVVFDSEKRGG